MLKCTLFIAILFTNFHAIAQSPVIKPCFARQLIKTSFDTTKSRGVADNYFLWDNGATIVVRLISGSEKVRKRIRNAAAEWEKYANINFKFVSTGDAHLRIQLSDNGDVAYIGTEALNIAQDQPTSLIDTTYAYNKWFRMALLHDFGHILGLLDEHHHYANTIRWNLEEINREWSLVLMNGLPIARKTISTKYRNLLRAILMERHTIRSRSCITPFLADGHLIASTCL